MSRFSISKGILLLISTFFLSALVFAADGGASASGKFVAGKQYVEVTPPTGLTPLPGGASNTVQVVEFFSYGCPHCAELEPVLQTWLKNNGSKVNFHRIPVEWFRDWDNLAKAYYTAVQLKVVDKMNPALFEAVQSKKLNPGDTKAIAELFHEKANISPDVFTKTFESFSVNTMQTQGQQWAANYKIHGVPTLIVGERYLTDAGKVGSVQVLPEALDYLVALAKQSSK